MSGIVLMVLAVVFYYLARKDEEFYVLIRLSVISLILIGLFTFLYTWERA